MTKNQTTKNIEEIIKEAFIAGWEVGVYIGNLAASDHPNDRWARQETAEKSWKEFHTSFYSELENKLKDFQ